MFLNLTGPAKGVLIRRAASTQTWVAPGTLIPMNDGDLSVLKMLFEEHHRQLAEKRQKIHSVAEKTLALFLIVAGWLISTKEPTAPGVRWVIIIVAAVVAFGACRSIYINNRSYYSIAAVMRDINQALCLFEPGKYLPDQALYPNKWKEFGMQGKVSGALFHILAISVAATLCVLAALMRN